MNADIVYVMPTMMKTHDPSYTENCFLNARGLRRLAERELKKIDKRKLKGESNVSKSTR